MAATDATPFPVKGSAFAFIGVIISGTTKNPITGGLSGLAGVVSKDWGTPTSMTTPPVEIGTTGLVGISLSAAEMDAKDIAVIITATNTGALYFLRELAPLDLSEKIGMWDAQSPIRFEDLMLDLSAAAANKNVFQGGTNTLYTRGGVVKATGAYTETSGYSIRDKLT